MNLDKYEHIEKLWGYEIILVNNDKYCSKLLVIEPSFRCSLHKHILKTETFFVVEGVVMLEVIMPDNNHAMFTLIPGDNYHLDPGVYHRFWTPSKDHSSIILEISTPHIDSDSYRMEESGPLLND